MIVHDPTRPMMTRRLMLHGAKALLALLIACGAFWVVHAHHPQRALADSPACQLVTSAPTTVVSDAAHRAIGLAYWPDEKFGVLRNGTSYQFFSSDGAAPPAYEGGANGSFDNPVAGGLIGRTALQNPKHTYNYAAGGKIYRDPSSGTLISIYHSEVWPTGSGFPFYSRLGLMKSTDGGVNWYDLGEIVTPSIPYSTTNPNTVDVGDGTFAFVTDGGTTYMYVYYSEPGVSTTNYYTLEVARAPLADVVSDAAQGTVPTFTKYYQGSWSQAGLGGNASNLDTTNGFLGYADVSYNTAINRYIAVGFVGDTPYEEDLLESTDGLVWGNRQTVFSDPEQNVYQTLVGFGDDPTITGAQFYFYYMDRSNGFVTKRRTLSCVGNASYDATPGFSSTQAQNQWSYQYTDGITYTNMGYDSTNNRWTGPDSYDLVGPNWQHPGNTYDSVRAWTAPQSGTATITASGGTIRSSDSGGAGVLVKVLQNTTQIWPSSGWQMIAAGGSVTFPATTVTVASGDVIRFVVEHAGASNNYDTTIWDPAVTLPNAPTVTTFNDNTTNAGISYTGVSWGYIANHNSGDYQGDEHYATTNGDSVTFSFNGTGVDWLGESNSGGGDADITLDGVDQGAVNTVTTPLETRRALYGVRGLASGQHTLTITKQTGTYMEVDAFVVYNGGSLVNDNAASAGITYTGSSWGYIGSHFSSDYQGDEHYATANGDSLTYAFTGTGVAWLGEKNAGGGNDEVYLDNVDLGAVSTVATNREFQQVLFGEQGLSSGSHTLKIVKSSGSYVEVDAFAVTP